MARRFFAIAMFLIICAAFFIAFADEDRSGSINNLQKIIVTPSRSSSVVGDVPTDVSVIDSKTIESEAPSNTDDLLRYIPGVDVYRPTGFTGQVSTVTLRGFNPTVRGRTLVLIDGIPFNQIYSGEVHWNAINPKNVDRIEVVPGVSSIYGPGAMGGVINVITKKPEKFENNIDLSYGSFETRSFDVSQANKYGNFSYIISGGGYKTNGYVVAPSRHDYDMPTWKENYDGNVKMMYDFDETCSAGVTYRYYDETEGGGYKYDYGSQELNNLSFDIKKEFQDILELSTATYYSWEKYWWTQDNSAHTTVDYINTNPKLGWGGHAQALIKYPEVNKFWIGMDWDWGKIDSRDDYKDKVQGDETGGRQAKIGLYLQDEVTVLEKLMLYAGGYVSASVRQAHAKRLKAQELFSWQERSVDSDVRKYYNGVITSVAQIKAYEQAVKSHEIAVTGTKKGFEMGQRSNVDVLNAQQKLLESKRNLAKTRYQYILNKLQLKDSTGILSASDVEEVNGWLSAVKK